MASQSLTAEDRVGVMALLSNYVEALDSGDIEAFVSNFVPDARLQSGSGTANGHDELRAWFLARQQRVGDGGGGRTVRHFVGLPRIWGDGARSFAETYCLIPGRNDDDEIVISLVGRYEDTCVNVDGRWLFESRVIHGELVGEPSRPIVT